MSHELHYTSVARGLKPGSQGFCTVASTVNLPGPIADRLEGLSGYRPIFPPGDPSAPLNPPAISHLRLDLAGHSFNVLSRVSHAGLDYSDRGNNYAHHLAIDATERPGGGPAWLASQAGILDVAWSGEPRVLTSGRAVPRGETHPGICKEWKRRFGDAGWAGVMAESTLADINRPIYIIFDLGEDVLPLFAEVQALIPRERRWDVTFSTYYTGQLQGLACIWRGVLRDSPEAIQALRLRDALILDPKKTMGVPSEGVLIEQARIGMPSPAIVQASRPTAPTPSHQSHSPRPSVPQKGSSSDQDESVKNPELELRPRNPRKPIDASHSDSSYSQGSKSSSRSSKRFIILLWAGVAACLALVIIGTLSWNSRNKEAAINALADKIDEDIKKFDLGEARALLDQTKDHLELVNHPAIVAANTRLVAAEKDKKLTQLTVDLINKNIDENRLREASECLEAFCDSNQRLSTYPDITKIRDRIENAERDEKTRLSQFNRLMQKAADAPVGPQDPEELVSAREIARSGEETDRITKLTGERKKQYQAAETERARKEEASKTEQAKAETKQSAPPAITNSAENKSAPGLPKIDSIPVIPRLEAYELPELKKSGFPNEDPASSKPSTKFQISGIKDIAIIGLNESQPKGGKIEESRAGDKRIELKFKKDDSIEGVLIGTIEWDDKSFWFSEPNASLDEESRKAYKLLRNYVLDLKLEHKNIYYLLRKSFVPIQRTSLANYTITGDKTIVITLISMEVEVESGVDFLHPVLGRCFLLRTQNGEGEIPIASDSKMPRTRVNISDQTSAEASIELKITTRSSKTDQNKQVEEWKIDLSIAFKEWPKMNEAWQMAKEDSLGNKVKTTTDKKLLLSKYLENIDGKINAFELEKSRKEQTNQNLKNNSERDNLEKEIRNLVDNIAKLKKVESSLTFLKEHDYHVSVFVMIGGKQFELPMIPPK